MFFAPALPRRRAAHPWVLRHTLSAAAFPRHVETKPQGAARRTRGGASPGKDVRRAAIGEQDEMKKSRGRYRLGERERTETTQ